MAETSNVELREFIFERRQKFFCAERRIVGLRHRPEEIIGIDVEVAHLDHCDRIFRQKFDPRVEFVRPIIEARQIQQIDRDVYATLERVAD